jgi:hypothetical protein
MKGEPWRKDEIAGIKKAAGRLTTGNSSNFVGVGSDFLTAMPVVRL